MDIRFLMLIVIIALSSICVSSIKGCVNHRADSKYNEQFKEKYDSLFVENQNLDSVLNVMSEESKVFWNELGRSDSFIIELNLQVQRLSEREQKIIYRTRIKKEKFDEEISHIRNADLIEQHRIATEYKPRHGYLGRP